MIKDLMYIELKTGYSDDGPAWIGYVKTSKTKKTIYFNDHAFQLDFWLEKEREQSSLGRSWENYD